MCFFTTNQKNIKKHWVGWLIYQHKFRGTSRICNDFLLESGFDLAPKSKKKNVGAENQQKI